MRLDKACPVAIRCMMIRVYVYPLLMYCCEALPASDAFLKKANALLTEYAARVTGVRGSPNGAALRGDCGLPDLATVLDRSRASYLMVVRARDELHLTRLALADIIGRRRGCFGDVPLQRSYFSLCSRLERAESTSKEKLWPSMKVWKKSSKKLWPPKVDGVAQPSAQPVGIEGSNPSATIKASSLLSGTLYSDVAPQPERIRSSYS